MKTIYKIAGIFLALITPLLSFSQQQTTVVNSSNCNFTYTFNTTDEGFSSPSIYSDANDFGLYWNGSFLAETAGSALPIRSASTISGIYVNSESVRTTIGFDYVAPAGTQYRIRVISGMFNPPLEILATTANGSIWTSLPSTNGTLCLELQDADLALNTQIRYEITFRTINPGDISIDNFRRAAANIPLPVTFLSFIARDISDNDLKLIWNVGEENNVRGYEIESSTDGVNFSPIGYVTATGNANYSFTHSSNIKGTQFFRVRNIDIDNKYKYTGIIRVQRNSVSNDLKLYPSPVSDMLFIQHVNQPRQAKITVVNAAGNIVYQTLSQSGSFQTSINLSHLSKGIYFIRYDDGNNMVQTSRFLKQ